MEPKPKFSNHLADEKSPTSSCTHIIRSIGILGERQHSPRQNALEDRSSFPLAILPVTGAM